jgi:hypothetical protein
LALQQIEVTREQLSEKQEISGGDVLIGIIAVGVALAIMAPENSTNDVIEYKAPDTGSLAGDLAVIEWLK